MKRRRESNNTDRKTLEISFCASGMIVRESGMSVHNQVFANMNKWNNLSCTYSAIQHLGH